MPALLQAFTIAFRHVCASVKDSAKIKKTNICNTLIKFTIIPPRNANVLTDVTTCRMKLTCVCSC